MDGLSDSSFYEERGINDTVVATGAMTDSGGYPLGTGQSFSFGENFECQPGSPITFEASLSPVDANGELLSDERVEATIS